MKAYLELCTQHGWRPAVLGASDDTANVARAAGARVCDVPVNRGQGAALRLGYRIARAGGPLLDAVLNRGLSPVMLFGLGGY